MRRSMRLALALTALVLATLASKPASAYPFMIRHGFAQCDSCHTDPMGGETLTGFGRVMSQTTLSTRFSDAEVPTSAAELLYGIPEPEWLRLGGSFRVMNILQDGDFDTFPMQLDAYGQVRAGRVRVGGSVGVSRVPAGSPHARAAQVTSGNGDKDLNLISRNHWIGYDVGGDMLIRAGRINLPFGVRMPEHVMWVRELTRTDRESDQQHGVAVSYGKGQFRGELMAILGNYQISPDEFRERGYSFYGEYFFSPGFGLGLSSLLTRAESDRILVTQDAYTRQAHGLTARFVPFQDLVLLAEMDLLLSTETSAGYVGLLQADYEPLQGLHFMGTGEIGDAGKFDNVDALKGAGEPRLGGWLSIAWFFVTHFDLRLDVVARQEEQLAFQSQLHFYF